MGAVSGDILVGRAYWDASPGAPLVGARHMTRHTGHYQPAEATGSSAKLLGFL